MVTVTGLEGDYSRIRVSQEKRHLKMEAAKKKRTTNRAAFTRTVNDLAATLTGKCMF